MVDYSVRSPWVELKMYLRRIQVGKYPLRNVLYAIRAAILISVSYLATPLCLVSSLLGFKFLSVDLTQIGSVLWLDLYLRENALSKNTPSSKIYVTRSNFTDANKYILDLYSKHD